ncbi:MAG: hypothetical protein JXB03_10090 [Spirochaetales bacterium]|nr:hypothetical protein [Spirochaetales bacterium]
MKHPLRLISILCCVLSGLTGVHAQTAETTVQVLGAYYVPNHEGYQDSGFAGPDFSVIPRDEAAAGVDPALDPGRSIGSGWGSAEAKGIIERKLTWPLSLGTGVLTKGGSIGFRCSGELSPVSVNGVAQFTVAPFAFLSFSTGLSAGTGWTLVFNGLGRNIPGPDREAAASEPFSGLVARCWQSATLQFDLAAVYPGEWNHVVAAATGRVEYKGYTLAGKHDAWQYEADSGRNFNGFKFLGSYFLGYRMPLVLDTLGFLVETNEWIDYNRSRSSMDSGGWGSDLVNITLGPVFNFTLPSSDSLAVLIQFKNGVDYSDETTGYRYFAYRHADGTYWKFHRIALRYTMKIKKAGPAS